MTRKALTVGILAEMKNEWERRAPLTPDDVRWLVERKIPVEVVSSPLRIFPDRDYRAAGATVVASIREARLIVGVKEPPVDGLLHGRVYMVFSHTTKGQASNRALLRRCVEKKVTLVDYEHIVDRFGERLVFFGRYAGICGTIDSLHLLGRRLGVRGIETPFSRVKRCLDYGSYAAARRHLHEISSELRHDGFDRRIAPFIVGVTGHGNVSRGVREVLKIFHPIEIHPRDIARFTRHQRKVTNRVYQIVLLREEKFRRKRGRGFYFEEYLSDPERFTSNMDRYLPHLGVLIHTSYWSQGYPRLVPERLLRRLWREGKLSRLQVIGDLSCDPEGSIEITRDIGTPGDPSFVYDPATGKTHRDPERSGIAVLAVDNLPAEFPREATEEFSRMIREFVYQVAAHGATDLTEHAALPTEVRDAVVVQRGALTDRFRHLGRYVQGP